LGQGFTRNRTGSLLKSKGLLAVAVFWLVLALGVAVPGVASGDGTPDPSFGGTGIMTLDLVDEFEEGARDVIVDGQGRIVIVESGRYAPTGYRGAFVARFLPDGTLDTSFSAGDDAYPDGIKDIAEVTDVDMESLAIDSKGRIVVGGWFTTPTFESE